VKKLILLAVAASALTSPLLAQSYEDQKRWDDAQARYQRETDVYQQERDRYYQSRARNIPNARSGPTIRSIAARTANIIASAATARPA